MSRIVILLVAIANLMSARSRTEEEDLRTARVLIKASDDTLHLTEDFYPPPGGGSRHALPDPITARQKALILQSLNRSLAWVLGQHKAKFDKVQLYLGQPLQQDPKISVDLEARRLPELQSELQTRTIFVDVSVFGALLKSAIASAMARPGFNSQPPDQAVDEFIGMVERMKLFAKGKPGVYSPELSVFIQTGFQRVLGRFREVLEFALAHEVGHLTMHHAVCSQLPDCSVFAEHELAADRYATYLTVHEWMNGMELVLTGFGGDGSRYTPDPIQGVETFFDRAYELAGFRSKGDCACSYPEPGSRKSQMGRVISDAGGFDLGALLEKAAQAHPKSPPGKD